ncbi:MAG: PAS domain S-box protein [Syntrophobacteraceae bacterium]|jgi:PAS domain S-box-containing protein
MTTPDGRFVDANPAYCSITGYSIEELRRLEFPRLIHPDDYTENMKLIDRMIAGQIHDFVIENRYFRKDAEIVWVRKSVSLVRNEEGEPQWIIALVEDATVRKQAEEALRESEERLRLLGDNLPESAVYQYVHETDGSVRFLYFSAGIERLNGVKVEEVLRDAGTLHRQSPPEYIERLKEAEAKSARELSDFDMEIPMRLPDGQTRWMRLHSRPRRMSDGRTIWDGVQIDVTGRKRAEEALRESEAKYRTLFENIQELLTVYEVEWDDHGRIVERRLRDGNPAFLRAAGVSSIDEIRGKTSGQVFGKDWSQFHLSAVQEAMETGEVLVQEAYRPESGRYYITTVVPLDANTYIGTGLDITERKRAEQELRLSEEKFSLAFANNPAAIAMTRLTDGLFLEVNDTWVVLNGYSREEAIGRSAREMQYLADKRGCIPFRSGVAGEGFPARMGARVSEKVRRRLGGAAIGAGPDGTRRNGGPFDLGGHNRTQTGRGRASQGKGRS